MNPISANRVTTSTRPTLVRGATPPMAAPIEGGFEQIPLAVVVLDSSGSAVTTNSMWDRLTGLGPDGSVRQGWLEVVHPDDRKRLLRRLGRWPAGHEAISVDCRMRDGRGWRWTRWWGRTEPSATDLLVVAVADIDDDRRREVELDRLASIDPLTGLPNRTQVLDHIRRCLRRLGRGGDNMGIMFLDLDHFKEVNDGAGHQAGDDVLARVAERLQNRMRPGDIVGRVGGDEFVVVCNHLRSPSEGRTISRRVLGALTEPIVAAGRPWFLSGTIGMAITGNPHAAADALVARADQAMYLAKQAKRSQAAELDPASVGLPRDRTGADANAHVAWRADGSRTDPDICPEFADWLVQRLFTAGLVLADPTGRPGDADPRAEAIGLLDGIVQDVRAAVYRQDQPTGQDAGPPDAVSPERPTNPVDDAPMPHLTPREREVLLLLGQAHNPKTIARELFMTVHTARGHVKNVMSKLDAHTQVEAVVVAARRGLLHFDDDDGSGRSGQVQALSDRAP